MMGVGKGTKKRKRAAHTKQQQQRKEKCFSTHRFDKKCLLVFQLRFFAALSKKLFVISDKAIEAEMDPSTPVAPLETLKEFPA